MRIALLSIAAAGFVATSPVHADDQYDKCMDASDGANASFSACGGDWIKRADAALNAAWADLKTQADPGVFRDLLDEQRAWNAYKEKSCMFLTGGWFGREGQTIHYPSCRAAVIEERTGELTGYLDHFKPVEPEDR